MESMAGKGIVYFQDLPFQLRKELCDILDADSRWEELGRILMAYNMTTFIRQSVSRNKSPTWELLKKYSEKEGTVKQLFTMLENMDHQRAMTVLKPYVDKKFQCVSQTDDTVSPTVSSSLENTNDIMSPTVRSSSENTNDIMSPTVRSSLENASDMFTLASTEVPLTTCSSPSTSAMDHLSGAEEFSGKQKQTSSTSPKLNHDSLNLNMEFSKKFLNSKMNDLNIPQSHSRRVAIKRSSKDSNSGTNSSDCEESGLTKCIPDKTEEEDCLQSIIQISYEDVCKATGNFSKDRILGIGEFGTVYRGEWKGTFVAIKRVIFGYDPAQDLESIKRHLNEFSTVKILRYDFVLPLYAVSLDEKNICLIYQYMVNGSLEDRLLLKNETSPLTWSQRSHIAECIAEGLNYLHTAFQKPLIHCNIKSSSILLDANMNAKIGNFALTREGPGCQGTYISVSNFTGTAIYLPLEYLRQNQLSPEVDIYSYGIVLLEISTGLRRFDAKRGEGKHLLDQVQLFANSGRLELLRDTKAGEENMIWFRELLYMGQICSNVESKNRPPLSQILPRFAKIKQDISMFDEIQGLPNDKSICCQRRAKNNNKQMQWYDDLHQSTRSETFSSDENFSLESSRDPGCSAGVSGISVSHEESLMASSSARAEALSCESPSSGEVD